MAPGQKDSEFLRVMDQVDRIGLSTGFRRSGQLRSLLRYVVERSLEQQHLVLKEYTLGVDVFGRPEDYDPRLDAIVRVQANNLRSRLKDYYDGEGGSDDILIQIPEGAYVPRITLSGNDQGDWVAAASRPTIAVLPFATGDPPVGQEYLAAGISGAVIANLSNSQSMHVLARASSSVFAVRPVDYRKAAEALNASHLLDGSVKQAGTRVQVEVQLIDSVRNELIWAETFERENEDLSKLQADIAKKVVENLQMSLSEDELVRIREPGTENAMSYHAYLEGWHGFFSWTADGLSRARDCFQRAVQIDPKNGPAHAGLAWAWFALANNGVLDSIEAAQEARRAADDAVANAPKTSEAQTALGLVLAAFEHRWDQAEAAYREAIRLAPNSSFAHHTFAQLVLIPQRRFDEAVSEMRLARELDPLSVVTVAETGFALYVSGRCDEAFELLTSAIELHPAFYALYDYRAFTLDRMGRHEEAWLDMNKAYELEKNPMIEALLAYLAGRSGRQQRARELYEEVSRAQEEGLSSSFGSALAAIGVGRKDEAFEHLERCYQRREPALRLTTVGFGFEHLWDDPRFDVLRRKMRLPDPLAGKSTLNR